MNILVLNYEYPPLGGGAAPICQDLAEFYARSGHRVSVITMAHGGLARREERGGVAIRRVPCLRRHQATCSTPEMVSYVASALMPTVHHLRRGRIDAIHCHFVVPTGLLAYLATRVCGVPYLITSHGSDIPGYNPDRFTKEHRFMTPLLRRIMRHAAGITVPSHFMQDLIRSNVGDFGVEYVPYGIDVDKFVVRPKKSIILMAGRLLPRKGFQHVLTALKDIDTDFEVHIAGDGPLRAQLEAQACELRMPVRFHGWLEQNTPEFKRLFEEAAILCLPSEMENSPVSLKEAMLTETAVLTSNTSGCPEVVGDTGLVVTPGNAGEIREALCRLLASETLRRDLGRRARQRVLDSYDAKRIGNEYLQRLEEASRRARERRA